MVEFIPVMPNNFIEIVLGVIKGEVERHVGVVDVDIDELDDVLVRNLPEQHDFADGGGGDAVAVLGLLELFDGDGFGGSAFGSGQEDEAVSAFSDFA